MKQPLVLAMTGASGAAYAVRLLEQLLRVGREVHLAVSDSARVVFAQELDLPLSAQTLRPADFGLVNLPPSSGRLHSWRCDDFLSPIASGSFRTAGMIVCPCSGATLGAIAHAQGHNLIHRAAEVHLKERRKLVVVPRETPLSLAQLENMTALTRMGGVVLPAAPGWYHGVKSIQDLVDFVVARVLDQFEIEHQLIRRWGEA